MILSPLQKVGFFLLEQLIMDSFVYRWRNSVTRQWYIGYHKGTDADGYICSSKTARPQILANPEQWQRRILRRGTKREMVALEHRLLKRLRAKSNPRSLNRSNGAQDCVPGSVDILGWDINKTDVDTILNNYVYTIQQQDWTRRLYIEQWLLRKVFTELK